MHLSTFLAWKIDKLFWFHLFLLHLIRYITAFLIHIFSLEGSNRIWFCDIPQNAQLKLTSKLSRAQTFPIFSSCFPLSRCRNCLTQWTFSYFLALNRSVSPFRSFHSIKSHHIFSLAAGCIEKTQKCWIKMKLLKSHIKKKIANHRAELTRSRFQCLNQIPCVNNRSKYLHTREGLLILSPKNSTQKRAFACPRNKMWRVTGWKNWHFRCWHTDHFYRFFMNENGWKEEREKQQPSNFVGEEDS